MQDGNLEFHVSRPIHEGRHGAGDNVTLKIDPADLILVNRNMQ
ncbi:hypothetical protein [Hasllibacter sp. MH4015]|nr:hypothetical protein [Hasllibacter sp. MH4015]